MSYKAHKARQKISVPWSVRFGREGYSCFLVRSIPTKLSFIRPVTKSVTGDFVLIGQAVDGYREALVALEKQIKTLI